jgi:hypothetical protein
MEPLTADRTARRLAIETYRTVDAFDTVAWRPPSPRRYDARPANDYSVQPSLMEELKAMPGWVIPVTGAFAAALMGLLLGGALAV